MKQNFGSRWEDPPDDDPTCAVCEEGEVRRGLLVCQECLEKEHRGEIYIDPYVLEPWDR